MNTIERTHLQSSLNRKEKLNDKERGLLVADKAARVRDLLVAVRRIDSRYAAALVLRARSRKRGVLSAEVTDC